MKLPLLFAGLLALPVVLMAEAPGVAPATSGDAAAAPAAASASENGRNSTHPLRRAWRHRLLEKFDADDNGRLSPAEREKVKTASRETIATRRAERFRKLDADSNGQISRAEWDAAPRPRVGQSLRQRILNRFDADRDGLLSPTERAGARSAFRSRIRN